MKYKYEIIVGIEFTKDKTRLTEFDLNFTLTEIANEFGGYSITEMRGGYIMSLDGSLVEEKSLNVTILSPDSADIEIRGFANELKSQLNQESVLVVKTEVTANFI